MNRLRRAAITAFVAHLIAGASMALILSHGLETNTELTSRLSFIVDHRVLWSLAWFTWTAASISFLYFCDAYASTHRLERFAVFLAAAAITADIAGHTTEFAVLPEIARHILRSESGPEWFLQVHRLVVLLSGYVANTLYSVATLVLAWSTRRLYPRRLSVAGFAVAFVGFGLSIAALLGSVVGLLWTNGILIAVLLLWLAMVALQSDQQI